MVAVTRLAAPDYRLVRPLRAAVPAPVLDDAQRRVVEHRGGPLLVLAGPGTGKTTTLVEAAVARVQAGVPVEHILMLTFSRRAAGELRDRVTARLDRTLREPVARTLHSYAFGVLRMAAVANGLPAPRLLAGAEQDVILRQLVAGNPADRWPVALQPALQAQAFAGELRDLLMRAVERGLDGPALAALGRARGRPDWVAAGQFLREYQDVTALGNPGGYDPAELIRSALSVLEDDAALLTVERSARRHIFVDEYQDTDPAQAELLALVAAGAEELILVGDPDQSIYAFRGADESAIREVDSRFGAGSAVPVVSLRTSRRCGSSLLAASRRVAERLPGRGEQRRLVPAGGLPAGSVEVGVLRSSSEEAAYVAGVLRRAHLDGLAWSRMAVLVRSTATVLGTLRRAMITAGVPVTVRGEDLPLAAQPAVAMFLDVLACVLDPAALTEDAAERLLLGPVGGADTVYLRRLRRVLRQLAEPMGQATLLAPALLDVKGAAVLPEHVRRPVARVAAVLDAGRHALAGGSPEEMLWAVWDATGLARRWELASRQGGALGAAADRDLDAVVALFAAAARFTDRLPAAGAAAFAEHLDAQQIPGDTLTPGSAEADAVTILTAHASKGLEWDLVCVANVQEGSWPDLRRRGSLLGSELLVDIVAGRDAAGMSTVAPQLAEERRLFYVAVTRARQRVVVTAVAGDEEQPSRFLDELDPIDGDRGLCAPHRGVHLAGLVAELRAVVCDPDADAGEQRLAAVSLAELAVAGVPGVDPGQWWGLAALSDDGPVADPARPVAVSPSRLESYLRCELRALLTDLGARDGDQISASLGMLVHELAAAAPPGTELAEYERLLDERWDTLDFGAPWFARNERARAGKILARLVDWLRVSRGELALVGTEQGFEVEVGDAVIRGRVDRLERDRDGRLVVVDLKTGKSKPKPDELPKHPQLAAYQLAIEHGAFETLGERPGGALLVQLAAGGEKGSEQRQGPLAESDDPDWIAEQVRYVAARLRGSAFTATIGTDCRSCDAVASCPLQAEGRQVTT
ncbi:MAG: ATP-dependent helicase [Pseudonocardiales bacterium]|nr:MAG: ATP-dependent helicase [Pseudonocardiales bacterium]